VWGLLLGVRWSSAGAVRLEEVSRVKMWEAWNERWRAMGSTRGARLGCDDGGGGVLRLDLRLRGIGRYVAGS